MAAAAIAQPVGGPTPHNAHTQRHKNKPQAAALMRLKTVRAAACRVAGFRKRKVQCPIIARRKNSTHEHNTHARWAHGQSETRVQHAVCTCDVPYINVWRHSKSSRTCEVYVIVFMLVVGRKLTVRRHLLSHLPVPRKQHTHTHTLNTDAVHQEPDSHSLMHARSQQSRLYMQSPRHVKP